MPAARQCDDPVYYPVVVGTWALAYVSRASLRAPRSHGFYRFFAWEAILARALLNVDIWFRAPFSWRQLVSWPLLIVSAFLVMLCYRTPKVYIWTLDKFSETRFLATDTEISARIM